MKTWTLSAQLLLLALAAHPCSMFAVRKLWTKNPDSQSRLFAFEQNGRVGFIDPAGRIVINPVIFAHIEDVGDFSGGLARVDHQGYIDESGTWVIKRDFSWEYDFSDGLGQVVVDDPERKNKTVGLVLDLRGKVVAKVPAFKTSAFSEGLAPYEAEGKPAVRKFEPGNLLYRDYPGLKGFLDRTGNVFIKPVFAEVGPFSGGLARAALDGYCFLATPEGYREGSPTSGYPSSCGGAPADAVSPCKVGFINKEGNFAIQPRFESARDFQEQLAAVRMEGLWGFIDSKGEVAIPARFEQAQSFSEGLAAVKMRGKWGFIGHEGTWRISPRFEAVDSFSDSLAIAYRHQQVPYTDQQSFYIDRNGNTQIAGPFREATPFVHGLAAVLVTDKHVAYINHAGKTVFDYFRH